MYVYIRKEPGLFAVGHFDPTGRWNTNHDYNTREKAALRAAWLNQGSTAWWRIGDASREFHNDSNLPRRVVRRA
jgi:hypothetical protein